VFPLTELKGNHTSCHRSHPTWMTAGPVQPGGPNDLGERTSQRRGV